VGRSLRTRNGQVEPGAQSVDVGQVPHELTRRCGQPLDQGGYCHDPVVLGEGGLIGDIDDLELDLPREFLVAEATDRLQGLRRARGRAADVQRQ
jgi:hypothetical protein